MNAANLAALAAVTAATTSANLTTMAARRHLGVPGGDGAPTCPHCGKELPVTEEKLNPLSMLLLTFLLAGILMWGIWTFVAWALPYTGEPTLLEILAGQVRYILNLFSRIY